MMFLIRLIVLTLVFFIILNFHQIRSGRFVFQGRSFLLPFSLGFALVMVDTFLRVAFFYAMVIFVLVAALCYFLLRLLERAGKD